MTYEQKIDILYLNEMMVLNKTDFDFIAVMYECYESEHRLTRKEKNKIDELYDSLVLEKENYGS